MVLIPSRPVPPLSLPLSSGGSTDDLVLGTGVDGRFSLVIFYRGLHCPVCRKQLSEVRRRRDELTDAGIGRVVAVSMENAERSLAVVEQWRLGDLDVAYGLSEASARAWGLFISTAINEDEPARFNEPGMFILDRDATLYWSSVTSMPFGRPALDDIIAGVTHAEEKHYPARGAA